jgi:hypothetical protein
MQDTSNHGRAHYRCRFPAEYALAKRIEHPAAVYVREDVVVGPLDAWLAAALHPDLVAARLSRVQDESVVDAGVEAARRELAECDRLLGTASGGVGGGRGSGAGRGMDARSAPPPGRCRASLRVRPKPSERMSEQQIAVLLGSLGGLLGLLTEADADRNPSCIASSACR